MTTLNAKTVHRLTPALEDMDAEIEIQVNAETPVELDLGIAGGDADLEMEGEQPETIQEDTDAQELVEGITALEGIYDMIQALPATNGVFTAGVLSGFRPALEANDMVASNAEGLVGDGNKQGFGERVKEGIKKMIAALASMAAGFVETVKAAWARTTDRLVRAAEVAKKLKASLGSESMGAGNIEDEKLAEALATAGNISPLQALDHAFEHATAMGDRATSDLLTNSAAAISFIARGKADKSIVDKLHQNLQAIAGTYPEKANVDGKESSASKPFFGGYRAWVQLSDNLDAEGLGSFNHGLSKVDEVQASGPVASASVNDVNAICDSIIKMSQLVPMYRKKLDEEAKLAAALKSASSSSAEGDEETQAAMSTLNKIMPKIVKGPQVNAYNYAGQAAAIAIRYVSASRATNAQRTDAPKVQNNAQQAPAAAAA